MPLQLGHQQIDEVAERAWEVWGQDEPDRGPGEELLLQGIRNPLWRAINDKIAACRCRDVIEIA